MTQRLTRTAVTASIAAVLLALAPWAFAASEQGDAGDLRATAQDLGDEAVTTITGTYLNAGDADMYRICLTDGRSFSASTVGATTLDTQLFLLDSQGYGVYANDDWNFKKGSMLPANHRFSPQSGGVYYLAISEYNKDPHSLQGEIFRDDIDFRLYPDAVVNANGFGGGGPHVSWRGRENGRDGSYTITLTGARVCVPPDTTPPTVDLRSPANGARVKQGADVVVDFSCADEGGSGIDSCEGTTADGAKLDTSKLGDVSVTVTARDRANNETVVKHTVTVVDETAPAVTIDSPLDGGVYVRDEKVTARYSCADEPGGSGVASCKGPVADGAAVDTSTLGEHTFAVDAEDNAGNRSSASATYTVVDRTPPTIALTTPAGGAVYGLGEQVTAYYSCADEAGGSGLASCVGTVPAGAAIDTSSVGEKSFTVDAADVAGNPASVRVTYTVVDRSAPSIALASPADGAVYTLGQSVAAEYSCQDQAGGSGVATCEGTVANGAEIDTSRVGSHSFQVRTTDNAGNADSKTVSYSVAYDFDGFFWPVQNSPKVNRWKAGAPVPVRFSLGGFRGERPEAPGYPQSTSCDGGDSEQAARAARKKPVFEYERRSGRYSMMWKTDKRWAGECREFVLKLDDGSVHTARFEFARRGHRDRDDD